MTAPLRHRVSFIARGDADTDATVVTLPAAAGVPDIKERLLDGHQLGEKTFTVHLDGWNMLPYLRGEVADSPRPFFFYFSDDGDLLALRFGDWKMTLMEQRAKQMSAWIEPFVPLRVPHMFNLRRDPFERALENSNTYYDWMVRMSREGSLLRITVYRST